MTAREIVCRHVARWSANREPYARAHMRAWSKPADGFERALVAGVLAWAEYATQHRTSYEAPVGDDGVLGDPWADWGRGLRALLNGESGRLDCGFMDALIHEVLHNEGVEP